MTLSNFEGLIGQKIVNIDFKALVSSKDLKFDLIIETEEKTFNYFAEGDCCSTSWITAVDDYPKGATILAVEERDIGHYDDQDSRIAVQSDDPYDDVIQQYFYEFLTDKGNFTVEMRNSSNGYYGGYLYLDSINEKEKQNES